MEQTPARPKDQKEKKRETSNKISAVLKKMLARIGRKPTYCNERRA